MNDHTNKYENDVESWILIHVIYLEYSHTANS